MSATETSTTDHASRLGTQESAVGRNRLEKGRRVSKAGKRLAGLDRSQPKSARRNWPAMRWRRAPRSERTGRATRSRAWSWSGPPLCSSIATIRHPVSSENGATNRPCRYAAGRQAPLLDEHLGWTRACSGRRAVGVGCRVGRFLHPTKLCEAAVAATVPPVRTSQWLVPCAILRA
jgi:hypothetical protein